MSEFLNGLRQAPKRLPSKFFYDEEGSRLFEQICDLEEYYPTRTELAILQENAGEIGDAIGEGAPVVELGTGSSTKIRTLLRALRAPAAYVPVEICQERLDQTCRELKQEFPSVPAVPVCADYTNGLHLPNLAATAAPLLFFPGSTIGNFEPIEALAFLQKLVRLTGHGARLLIGVDLKKDRAVLEAAYNDRQGVTAAFNRNILERANRDFGTTFNPESFAHRAWYDADHGRIVMQLESTVQQSVEMMGERVFFAEGERITTEYSYKYTLGEFNALARLAGFVPQRVWTDEKSLFSVHLLQAE